MKTRTDRVVGSVRTLAAILCIMLAAAPARSLAAGFDARANAFQYASEYRDPLWAGVYLRARWYHPELQSFISRDPARTLTHYSYGGGNPVRNVDPNGMSYRGFARGVGSALRTLNAGAGGHFARFFLSPALGVMQILANPKGFWRMLQHDTSGVDVFLAVGVVSEIGFSGALWAERQPGLLLHVTHDLALGLGQSTTAAANRGFGRFNWGAFGQGAEYSIGPIVEGRLLGGLGYQPYRVRPEQAEKFAEGLPLEQVAYYRARVGGWATPLFKAGGRDFLVKLSGGTGFGGATFSEVIEGRLGREEMVYSSLREQLDQFVGGPQSKVKMKIWLNFEGIESDSSVGPAIVQDRLKLKVQQSSLVDGMMDVTNVSPVPNSPRLRDVPKLAMQNNSSGTSAGNSLVLLSNELYE